MVLTEMEHHANLVPWHILAQEKNIRLEFIPITSDGLLDMEAYEKLLLLEPTPGLFYTHVECPGNHQSG